MPKIRSSLRLLTLLLMHFLLFPATVEANKQLHLSNDIANAAKQLSLSDYGQVFEDRTGNLTIDDILNNNHQINLENPVNGSLDFNFTRSAYWMQIDLVNNSQTIEWYLNFLWAALSYDAKVYLFSEQDSNLSELQQLPRTRGIKFKLQLQHNQQYKLYLRAQDMKTPLVFWPELYSSQQMILSVKSIYPLYSFVVGGLFLLILYNLVYFFSLKDKTFLTLSLFTCAFVMELSNLAGVLHYFDIFRSISFFSGGTFTFLIISSALSLIVSLVDMHHYLPWLLPWYRITFWISTGMLFIVHMLPFGAGIGAIGGLVCITLLSVTVISTIRHKIPVPLSQRMAAVVIVVGTLPLLLRGTGLIDHQSEFFISLYIALLIALILLSFSQANKVQKLREQAERTLVESKAKDEFLTTMSHELRTPMNSIISSGNLLKFTQLTSQQDAYVSGLNVASRHMLSLVNNVLDLAQLDRQLLKLNKHTFHLDGLLQQLKQLVSNHAAEKGLQLILEHHFTPANRLLQGDDIRLRQVLLNLLDNAIKFTESGEVSLHIIPITRSESDVTLKFIVRDSGPGIPQNRQAELFIPFNQLDNSIRRKHGGSGLGLTICKRLIRNMGGKLEVSSTPGKGSQFFFTLVYPLKPVSKAKIVNTPEQQTNYQGSKTLTGISQVLLVDDDELNLFLGKEQLNIFKVTTHIANSGSKALKLLTSISQPINLVLLDVSMPDMDGYETARRIRSLPIQQPIIVALTAHALIGEKERCLAAGMDDYMTKPFELSDLEKILHQWLIGQSHHHRTELEEA